jgi:hypothetical protein
MKKKVFILTIFLAIVGCNQQKNNWIKVKQTNSIAEVKKFLNENSGGDYDIKAKKLLDSLEWTNALDSNTISIYKSFVNNYPNSINKDNALVIIDSLEWMNAQKVNTVICYKAFIKSFSNSRHVKEAKLNCEIVNLEDSLKTAINKNSVLKSIEDSLRNIIFKTGFSQRFFIETPNFTSKNTFPSSITLSAFKPGFLLKESEFPWDCLVYGFSGDSKGFGNGSILRFKDKVKFEFQDYSFIIGEGSKFQRLTFVLVSDKLVYMRGNGKIIKKNGEEKKLGY